MTNPRPLERKDNAISHRQKNVRHCSLLFFFEEVKVWFIELSPKVMGSNPVGNLDYCFFRTLVSGATM